MRANLTVYAYCKYSGMQSVTDGRESGLWGEIVFFASGSQNEAEFALAYLPESTYHLIIPAELKFATIHFKHQSTSQRSMFWLEKFYTCEVRFHRKHPAGSAYEVPEIRTPLEFELYPVTEGTVRARGCVLIPVAGGWNLTSVRVGQKGYLIEPDPTRLPNGIPHFVFSQRKPYLAYLPIQTYLNRGDLYILPVECIEGRPAKKSGLGGKLQDLGLIR